MLTYQKNSVSRTLNFHSIYYKQNKSFCICIRKEKSDCSLCLQFFLAGFKNEDDMLTYISNFIQNQSNIYTHKQDIVGVVFDNFVEREKDTNFNYRIRTYMDETYGQLFPDILIDPMGGKLLHISL